MATRLGGCPKACPWVPHPENPDKFEHCTRCGVDRQKDQSK